MDFSINFPNAYIITVTAGESRSSYTVTDESDNNRFKDVDIQRSPKIYMLISTDQFGTIHYVGQTTTGIKQRLDTGITTDVKHENNYSWSNINGTYNLLVWNVPTEKKSSSYDLDRVESELAFAARVNQGFFPTYQTSIKFRSLRQSGNFSFVAPQIARAMMGNFYEYLKTKSDEDSVLNSLEEKRLSLDKLLVMCIPET